MTAESSVFTDIFKTVAEFAKDIGVLVGEIATILVKDVVPLIMPFIRMLLDVFRDLTKEIFPIFTNIIKTVIPILSNILKTLLPAISSLFKSVGKSWVVILKAISEALLTVFKSLQKDLPIILPALSELIVSVGKLVTALAPAMGILIKLTALVVSKLLAPGMIRALTSVVNLLSTLVSSLSDIIGYYIEKYGASILDKTKDIFDTIVKYSKMAWDKMKSGFLSVFNWLKNTWTTIKEFFGFPEIGKEISGIFKSMLRVMMTSIEVIKKLINKSIIAPLRAILNWKVPLIDDRLKDILHLPAPRYLQFGGIVTKPTLAVAGEAGPEAVIPLKKEILQKIVPTLLPEIKLVTPSEIETKHESETLAVLKRIAKVLEAKPVAPQVVYSSPKVAFTLHGFVR
jgi:phage-related protein